MSTPSSGPAGGGAVTPAAPGRIRRIMPLLGSMQGYIGLVLVIIIGIVTQGSKFADATNFTNAVGVFAPRGILAVGMTLVIIAGGIDLSVGSLLAVGATTSAILLRDHSMSPWAIVPICMLVCAVFGFVNGAGTALLRIQSFVMTLAMMTIARGIVRLASGSVSIGTIAINADGNPTQASQTFSQLGTPGTNVFGGAKVIGYFPVLALVAVVIIFQLILSKTKFGRHVYAVGGNPIAARLSGVKVVGVTIAVFTIGGMMAGLAGPINAAYNASADPQAGLGYELDAIAAVVIGGASLFGGRGSVIGTFVGSLILTLLDNVLGLNSVSDNWQMIIKGVIVVLAVVIQRPELFSDLASWVKRTFRRQPAVVGPDAAGLTAPAADAGGSDTVGTTTKAADPTIADNGDQRPPNPEGGRA